MTSSLTVELDPATSEAVRTWAKDRDIPSDVVVRMWISRTLHQMTRTALKEAEIPMCSFCDKRMRSVEKLIAGPGVFICNECIDLCVEVIEEERTSKGR